jgi:hypothetical protein
MRRLRHFLTQGNVDVVISSLHIYVEKVLLSRLQRRLEGLASRAHWPLDLRVSLEADAHYLGVLAHLADGV